MILILKSSRTLAYGPGALFRAAYQLGWPQLGYRWRTGGFVRNVTFRFYDIPIEKRVYNMTFRSKNVCTIKKTKTKYIGHRLCCEFPAVHTSSSYIRPVPRGDLPTYNNNYLRTSIRVHGVHCARRRPACVHNVLWVLIMLTAAGDSRTRPGGEGNKGLIF